MVFNAAEITSSVQWVEQILKQGAPSFALVPVPAFFLEDLPVEFVFPEHLQGLPLRIVVRASQLHDGGLTSFLWLDDFLDQPPS